MVILIFKRIEFCLQNSSRPAYRPHMMHKYCQTLLCWLVWEALLTENTN